MGYGAYYLIWLVVSVAARSPWLLLGIVVFFVLRRFLPDPAVYLRTMGRIRGLEAERQANPANITVRRDLARIYLQRRRPRKALQYLEEAAQRAPDDAELLYLRGAALVDSGRPEEALAPLVHSVEIDPRVAFGEPYLVAGRALRKLGKLPEAEDSLLRYLDLNTSSVVARVQLAQVLQRAGRAEEASRMVDEAIETHRVLPGYARRAQFGARVDAERSRITIQRDPKAIIFALVVLSAATFLVLRVVPAITRSAQRLSTQRVPALVPSASQEQGDDESGYDEDPAEVAKMRAAFHPDRFRRLSPAEASHAPLSWQPLPEAPGPSTDLAIVQSMCAVIGTFGPPDSDPDGNPGFVFVDKNTNLHAGIRVLNGSLAWATEDSPILQTAVDTQTALLMAILPAMGPEGQRECEIVYVRNGQKRRSGYRNGVAFSEAAGR